MLRRSTAAACRAIAIARAAAVAAQAHYFDAPCAETPHVPAFGQAPVFVPHTSPQLVVFGKDYRAGDKNQVYVERFDGRRPVTCLTCTGPGSGTYNVNGAPAVSPYSN